MSARERDNHHQGRKDPSTRPKMISILKKKNNNTSPSNFSRSERKMAASNMKSITPDGDDVLLRDHQTRPKLTFMFCKACVDSLGHKCLWKSLLQPLEPSR